MATVINGNEIASPVLERKRFTSDEVHRMVNIGILPEESGWELIDGEIIHRMTIGSRHAGTVIKLGKLLERLIGRDFLISTQNPIQISEYDEPKPDLAVLKMRNDFYTTSLPKPADVLLVIEVSVSTLEFDREIKKKIYARAGIIEFWLINLGNGTIEVYSKPKDGGYFEMKIYERGDVIYSKHIENLKLKVRDVILEETE